MGSRKGSTASSSFRWVTPQQARSQSTMDRLLNALESLLGHHAFDDITVAMICTEADSHVGSFYNLFKDKGALLECLLERIDRDRIATFAHALDLARKQNMTIEQRAAAFVRAALQIGIARPGALRAWDHARRHQGFTWPNAAQSGKTVLDSIVKIFMDCRDRIDAPNPRRAIEFAIIANQETVTRFTIDHHTLPALTARMSKAAVAESLTTMFLANLGVRNK